MPARLTPPDAFGRVLVALRREVESALRDSIILAETRIKQRYTGPTGPASLRRRTGLLAASVRREITGGPPPATIAARVFIPEVGGRTVPVYARIHEHGGTITPVKGQFLTIPLPSITGGRAARQGITIRNFPGGFFFRSRAGRLIYAMRAGRRGLMPLWVLVRSVRIPRRPVWATVAREVAPEIRRRFERAVVVMAAAARR